MLFSHTIPHGGLRTVGNEFRGSGPDRSPSHTVGLEHGGKKSNLDIFGRVTIPPSGLRTDDNVPALFEVNESPSHPVGLELCHRKTKRRCLANHHPTRWAQNLLKSHRTDFPKQVTIPHGGLGTLSEDEELSFSYLFLSPSHTVGLELQKAVR